MESLFTSEPTVVDTITSAVKLPPHSVEAEQSVLGGLMLDNTAWDQIGDVVYEHDFYRADHRAIYHHISALIEANHPADVLTVAEALERAGLVQEIGGIPYLHSLVESTPSAVNIRRYAEIVRERAILRSLVRVGTEIAESAYGIEGRSVRQLLDHAESRVLEIAESRSSHEQGFQSIAKLLDEVMEHLDNLAQNPSSVTGVSSGFVDLDHKTAGLHPGDLVIVAGRPSMGKTAFALNIAENVALGMHLPVLVFSMEMAGTQIASRFLSSCSRVDQHKLRTGQLEERDWDRLHQTVTKLREAPIQVDESGALTALEVRARARRMWRQYGGLGLIVVDYLQLMSASSGGENRATEISEISRAMKSLAKELKVPVLALSQLNRSLEQRPNKRPVMSDLRESGAIEQDADVILFIYRDIVYNSESPDKNMAEIIIGKQRNGPIGTVRLTFLGQHTRFENYVGENSSHG